MFAESVARVPEPVVSPAGGRNGDPFGFAAAGCRSLFDQRSSKLDVSVSNGDIRINGCLFDGLVVSNAKGKIVESTVKPYTERKARRLDIIDGIDVQVTEKSGRVPQ
jgi:hypothetical protein